MAHAFTTRRRWTYVENYGTTDSSAKISPSSVPGGVLILEPDGHDFSGGRGGGNFVAWDDESSYDDDFVAHSETLPTLGANWTVGGTDYATVQFPQGSSQHIYNGSANGGTGDHLSVANWTYDGTTATGFFTLFLVLRDEGSTNTDERILMSTNSDSANRKLPTDTDQTGIWLTAKALDSSGSHLLGVRYALRAASDDIVESSFVYASAPNIRTTGTVLCFMRGACSTDGGSNWTQAIRLATLPSSTGSASGNFFTSTGTDDADLGSMTGGATISLGGVGSSVSPNGYLKSSGTEIVEAAMYSSEDDDANRILQYDVGATKYAFAGVSAPDHPFAHASQTANRLGNYYVDKYDISL